MIAIEAKYHQNCLRSLYNRVRQEAPKGNSGHESCLHGISFVELVAFLEDTNNNEDNASVFKLIDIALLYKVRLEQLGLTSTLDKRIHTTKTQTHIAFGTFWSESTVTASFTEEGNTPEF